MLDLLAQEGPLFAGREGPCVVVICNIVGLDVNSSGILCHAMGPLKGCEATLKAPP